MNPSPDDFSANDILAKRCTFVTIGPMILGTIERKLLEYIMSLQLSYFKPSLT